MTAKEYLRQAYLLDQRIEAKLAQLQSLRELALKCTSVITGMPHGPNRGESKLENTLIKIVDMQTEINDDIDRLVDLKQEISTAIEALPDPQEQSVLLKRYLRYMSWAQIAEDLDYSIQHIYRLHWRALKNLSVPENGD